MINDHIRLIPIVNKEMLDLVHQAAREDEDGVLDPTHAVVKNGEIVGAVSVNVNCGSWWMHKTKTRKYDTLSTLQCLDTLMLDRGINKYYMPCLDSSPYYPLMERGGFRKLVGNWGIFCKEVKE